MNGLFKQIRIATIPLMLFSLEPLIAQSEDCERNILGTVLDIANNEPLPFATVKIKGSVYGSVANDKGEFLIENVCLEEIDLVVRFLGYKTVVHHHDIHHTTPTIYLAQEETMLESVVVEESRKEELKSLAVNKKEINTLSIASSSIGEITEELSGITLLKTGANVSKPMIHGLHSNRVLVINDGVRHAYQVWGEEHAPEIDPSHVDQIEIVKGAGTVKYGPEALGGVILYNSKKPAFDKKLNGSISTSYQTNGRAPTGNLKVGQGLKHFAWSAGGYGIYQGDMEAPDYNLSNTGKKEYGGSFSALLHQPLFDMQVSGSYFDQELGLLRAAIAENLDDLQYAIDNDSTPNPTFPHTYDLQSPRQATQHRLLKTNISFFPGKHVINFQYAFQRNDRQEFDVRRGELNDRPVIDLTLTAHNFDVEWIQPTNDRWAGNSGIQFFTNNSVNKPGTNPANFVPDYKVTNMGVYTIQSYTLNETIVELGARFDLQSLSVADTIRETFTYENSLDFSSASFTLGFRKPLSESWSIFSNVGTAWRPPNVAELYAFGYHDLRVQFGLWRYNLDPNIVTPVDSVYDQTLRVVKSEKGIKWITGVELKKKALRSEFIFYANQIKDYIFLRPHGITIGITGVAPYYLFDQTDALFLGSDWDIQLNHTQSFTSELKVSYVFAMSTEKKQPLLEIPPFNIGYSIDYKKEHWEYGLNLNYTADQWYPPDIIEPASLAAGETEVDPNTQIFDFMAPPADYLLLAAKLGFHKKKWKAQIKVNNLLNISYRSYTNRLRYFANAPGRNFLFSFQYKF